MGVIFALSALCANILMSGQDVANWRMLLGGVLVVVMLVPHIIQSLKLAKAFGKGTGFGSARYVGNSD